MNIYVPIDPDNAPVTEPYIRDILLEAHRQVSDTLTHCSDFRYVEIHDDIMFGLDNEGQIIYYNPNLLRDLSLNQICMRLCEVLHCYTMYLAEEHAVLEGMLLH